MYSDCSSRLCRTLSVYTTTNKLCGCRGCRLDQEAVLLYLSFTTCDHCFASEMTGTDCCRMGRINCLCVSPSPVITRALSAAAWLLSRQSVSAHPTAVTALVSRSSLKYGDQQLLLLLLASHGSYSRLLDRVGSVNH